MSHHMHVINTFPNPIYDTCKEFLTPLQNPNGNNIKRSKILENCVIQREKARMADMRNWSHLGVVDTIYEEECEFSSSSSSSVSPSLPSPRSSLHSTVDAWSRATGRQTDILIRVQGKCFRLHKERLTSRSSYLKRHLTEVSDFTLSPPLNITAETFASIAGFCYSYNVQITPSNVAALRTATELLGMTEAKGGADQENLGHVTEAYFRRVVAINEEYASMVLRSCLPLLPEAETTAFLVSRCIEALVLVNDGHRIDDVTCLEDVVAMHPQDFLVVAESMNRRFSNHDVLYKIVDLYLKENNFGKLTEEQRVQICNCIDCTKLSPRPLIDCVQNPRMPLRFIIRAMLVEQLNTRNSIVSAATLSQIHSNQQRHPSEQEPNSTTLGDFLHHDAVLRHSAQLRAAMDSTSSRIQSLEKELRGMKKLLLENQSEQEERQRKVLDSERPASFHFVPSENGNKIERGERGSVSSSGLRFDSRTENHEGRIRPCLSGESCDDDNGNPKVAKTFRQKLINRLKNAFRVSNSASKSN